MIRIGTNANAKTQNKPCLILMKLLQVCLNHFTKFQGDENFVKFPKFEKKIIRQNNVPHLEMEVV